jgi:hypothetical protein
MKDEDLNLEEIEVSHTLGGSVETVDRIKKGESQGKKMSHLKQVKL